MQLGAGLGRVGRYGNWCGGEAIAGIGERVSSVLRCRICHETDRHHRIYALRELVACSVWIGVLVEAISTCESTMRDNVGHDMEHTERTEPIAWLGLDKVPIHLQHITSL